MKNPNSYSKIKDEFDAKNKNKNKFDCFLPVHLEFSKRTSIKNRKGEPNEEYYKWQLIYSLIASDLFPTDCIGTEVYFPKGNRKSAPLMPASAPPIAEVI